MEIIFNWPALANLVPANFVSVKSKIRNLYYIAKKPKSSISSLNSRILEAQNELGRVELNMKVMTEHFSFEFQLVSTRKRNEI